MGFRLLRYSGPLAAVAYRREHRLAVIAGAHALVACALALAFPVHLFVLGPVLFGVVHVAADVRYLVLRQELARWWRWAIGFGCATLIGSRILEEANLWREPARLEFAFSTGFALVAVVAAVLARGSARRALLASGALICLGGAAVVNISVTTPGDHEARRSDARQSLGETRAFRGASPSLWP